ncbi:hypothetical protein ACX169_29265, partial [Bacillus cereus]
MGYGPHIQKRKRATFYISCSFKNRTLYSAQHFTDITLISRGMITSFFILLNTYRFKDIILH